MDYLKNLDKIIVSLLLEKKLDYSSLMKELSRRIGRNISSNTFNPHLDKLEKKEVLERKVDGRYVFYSITNNAKKEWRLNILGDDAEQIMFTEIYVKLLYYISTLGESWKSEHKYSVTETTTSQRALISYINQLTAEKIIAEQASSQILPKHSEIPFILLSDTPPEARLEEAERFIAMRKLDGGFKERNLPSYKPPFYEEMLAPQQFPGIELDAFLNTESFTNGRLKLTGKDVDKGVQLLKEEGIVKIRRHEGKTRIMFIDNDLLNFLTDLRYARRLELRIQTIEFYFLREPNSKEKKRLELLNGQKVTQEVLAETRVNRYRLRDVVDQQYKKNHDRVNSILQECKLGAEYTFKLCIDTIKEKYGRIIQEYKYLHKMIEWICPMVLQ